MKSISPFLVSAFLVTPLLSADIMTQREASTQRTPIVLSQIQKHAPAEPRIPIRQADLPLTITGPGSYYLTENIAAPETMPTAVTVAARGVTLDLMGFVLSGEDGTGIGGGDGAAIRNGTIRGFDYGIDTGDGTSVEAVTVVQANEVAIRVGTRGRVTRSSGSACEDDGGVGIAAGDYAIVTESSGSGCGDRNVGIRVGAHSVVVNSVGDGEHFAGAGIETGPWSTLRGCTAVGGLEPGAFSTVADCTATHQGLILRGNTVVTGCAIRDLWIGGDGNRVSNSISEFTSMGGDGNVLAGSVTYELHIYGDHNRIQDNHIGAGDIGFVEGEGNVLIGNTFGQ